MRERRVLAALLAAVLAAAWPAASRAETLDTSAGLSGGGDLASARARLVAAVEAAGRMRTDDAEATSAREALLDQAAQLRRDAARSRGREAPPELLAALASVAGQLEELIATAPPATSAASPPRSAFERPVTAVAPAPPNEPMDLVKPDLPILDVNAFHDVAEDARSVLGGLDAEERARVRAVTQEGEDAIARIKRIGDTDHVARAAELETVSSATRELQALHEAGLANRRTGRPFVPAHHAPGGWVDVGESRGDLEALRARFVPPGSAHVTLRNNGGAPVPAFVEVEFTDVTGEPTGSGAYQAAGDEPLQPGEVREVLVPITRTHPRFWDVTRGYLVHLE